MDNNKSERTIVFACPIGTEYYKGTVGKLPGIDTGNICFNFDGTITVNLLGKTTTTRKIKFNIKNNSNVGIISVIINAANEALNVYINGEEVTNDVSADEVCEIDIAEQPFYKVNSGTESAHPVDKANSGTESAHPEGQYVLTKDSYIYEILSCKSQELKNAIDVFKNTGDKLLFLSTVTHYLRLLLAEKRDDSYSVLFEANKSLEDDNSIKMPVYYHAFEGNNGEGSINPELTKIIKDKPVMEIHGGICPSLNKIFDGQTEGEFIDYLEQKVYRHSELGYKEPCTCGELIQKYSNQFGSSHLSKNLKSNIAILANLSNLVLFNYIFRIVIITGYYANKVINKAVKLNKYRNVKKRDIDFFIKKVNELMKI